MSISAEASILNSSYLGQSKHAVITLLNGKHELQPYIQLYPTDSGYIGDLPVPDQPVLELSMIVTPKHNALHVRTNNTLHKPKKGDYITFYFKDNTSMDVELLVNAIKTSGKMMAIILLDDLQMSRISNYITTRVSVVNSKTGSQLSYEFKEAKTRFYSSKEDGQRLFRESMNVLLSSKNILLASV